MHFLDTLVDYHLLQMWFLETRNPVAHAETIRLNAEKRISGNTRRRGRNEEWWRKTIGSMNNNTRTTIQGDFTCLSVRYSLVYAKARKFWSFLFFCIFFSCLMNRTNFRRWFWVAPFFSLRSTLCSLRVLLVFWYPEITFEDDNYRLIWPKHVTTNMSFP